jgi:hypothetical protein
VAVVAVMEASRGASLGRNDEAAKRGAPVALDSSKVNVTYLLGADVEVLIKAGKAPLRLAKWWHSSLGMTSSEKGC